MEKDSIITNHMEWLESDLEKYEKDFDSETIWLSYARLHDRYIFILTYLKNINKGTPEKAIKEKVNELGKVIDKMLIAKALTGFDLGTKK